MPLLTIDGARFYYRLDGPDEAPVVMLAHSLGQDHGMWDPQAADLSPHFRVLRYDIRGHGASDVTPGDYRIEQLGADALALADALKIDRFAFCGLSIGGMIGQAILAAAPHRITAAILANTSSRPDAAGMEQRRQTVLSQGLGAVADTVIARFFSPATLAANPPVVATSRRILLATDPVGYAGCCAAVRDTDLTGSLARISSPVLIVNGSQDVSLPWAAHGVVLAREIPGARVVHLPAAHLSNLEVPRLFTGALFGFLLATDAPAEERERNA